MVVDGRVLARGDEFEAEDIRCEKEDDRHYVQLINVVKISSTRW